MKIDILSLIKKAMLSKNSFELGVLRLIKTEFVNFQVAPGATELTETEEFKIIVRMIKQRKASIVEFDNAERYDLSEKEKLEIDFLNTFLPKEVSTEELTKYSIEVISKGGGNMGSYIKEIKLKYPTADGKKLADIVKSNLV